MMRDLVCLLGLWEPTWWGGVWGLSTVWGLRSLWGLWWWGWRLWYGGWRWWWRGWRPCVLLLRREHWLHGTSVSLPLHRSHHYLFPLHHWIQLSEGHTQYKTWPKTPSKIWQVFSVSWLLICNFVLQVPLVIFKREKELARNVEFDGLYITEQPEDDDIRGQWDRLVLNTP